MYDQCDEAFSCRGPGYGEHREHVLARMAFTDLAIEIIKCCGNYLSSLKSCNCCDYAEEIGRRSTEKGQRNHKKAVEDYIRYLQEKSKQ